MNGVWPWSPQTIMFSGYDVPQNDNADFYVKHQRAVTAHQEDTNIRLVQKKAFAPKTFVKRDASRAVHPIVAAHEASRFTNFC